MCPFEARRAWQWRICPNGRSEYPTPRPRFPIDLNRASAEELEQLPGIGPVLAARIVELRRQRGRFQSVEELLDVHGIGPKRLEQIRPYVVVR
jgi:competence protein ComEA